MINTFVNSIQMIHFVLIRLYRIKPVLTSVLFTSEIIVSILPAIHVALSQITIDSTLAYLSANDNPDLFLTLFFWLSIQSAVMFFQFLLQIANNNLHRFINEIFVLNIEKELNEKQLTLDLSYLEDPNYHNLISRALQGASSRSMRTLNECFNFIRQFFGVVSFMIVLSSLHWIFCLFGFFIAVPVFPIGRYTAKLEYDLVVRQQETKRKANVYSSIASGMSGEKEVRLWDFGNYVMNRWEQIRTRLIYQNLSVMIKTTFLSSMTQFANVTIGIAACLGIVYYGSRIIEGFTIGQATMYMAAFASIQSHVFQLLNTFNTLYENSCYFKDFHEFQSLKPLIEYPTQSHPVEEFENLTFDHVSFKYPGTDKWVLRDVSFVISRGDFTILHGNNGAGKSTIVKLLCRLYDPTNGCILINNRDIKQFTREAIKKYISVLFQNSTVYQVSLRENIAFSSIENINNTEQIDDLADRFQLREFSDQLSKGYETIMARSFYDGTQLSGGQCQKIVIARSLFSDSQILIMDEPTVYVDKNYKEMFLKFLEQETTRKTIIISTHDKEIITMGTNLLSLESGRIDKRQWHHKKSGRMRSII